jgi:hypothetical protein
MVSNRPRFRELKASSWVTLCVEKAGRRMLHVVRKAKMELPAGAKAQNSHPRRRGGNFHCLPYNDAPRKSLWRGTAT